jgi:hypothetical protein
MRFTDEAAAPALQHKITPPEWSAGVFLLPATLYVRRLLVAIPALIAAAVDPVDEADRQTAKKISPPQDAAG